MSSAKWTARTRGRSCPEATEAKRRKAVATPTKATNPRRKRLFTALPTLPVDRTPIAVSRRARRSSAIHQRCPRLARVEAPFGREEIEAILPHRDPFLLIDEVLELEPGKRVVARKQIA